ncbi:MAG: hypothetical protein J3R72DRAFT_435464 [Linnemannia gamsii]|nr:MAG: hypothetical protein J3R72DRAFT_435464 [Linnemannia gamsii]
MHTYHACMALAHFLILTPQKRVVLSLHTSQKFLFTSISLHPLFNFLIPFFFHSLIIIHQPTKSLKPIFTLCHLPHSRVLIHDSSPKLWPTKGLHSLFIDIQETSLAPQGSKSMA